MMSNCHWKYRERAALNKKDDDDDDHLMKIFFFVSSVKTQFAVCRDELAGHHKITGRFDSICKNRFSVFEQKQIFFFFPSNKFPVLVSSKCTNATSLLGCCYSWNEKRKTERNIAKVGDSLWKERKKDTKLVEFALWETVWNKRQSFFSSPFVPS